MRRYKISLHSEKCTTRYQKCNNSIKNSTDDQHLASQTVAEMHGGSKLRDGGERPGREGKRNMDIKVRC